MNDNQITEIQVEYYKSSVRIYGQGFYISLASALSGYLAVEDTTRDDVMFFIGVTVLLALINALLFIRGQHDFKGLARIR